MQVKEVVTLQKKGSFGRSKEWAKTRQLIINCVEEMHWPIGSNSFSINPVRKGNGVRPIKHGLCSALEREGWHAEEPLDFGVSARPGKIDAVYYGPSGPIAVEMETGNVSSSHRSINKMALGLYKGVIQAGIVILPARALACFLTDRIGNAEELAPYFELWQSIPITNGVLELIVFQHDHIDDNTPLIPKGKDGNALKG